MSEPRPIKLHLELPAIKLHLELPDLTGKSSVERARLFRESLAGLSESEHEVLRAWAERFFPAPRPLAERVSAGDLNRGLDEAQSMVADLGSLQDHVCHLSPRELKSAELWARATGLPTVDANELNPSHEGAEPDPLLADAVAFCLRWSYWRRGHDQALSVVWRLTAARAASGRGPIHMAGRVGSCMTELLVGWLQELAQGLNLAAALKGPMHRAREILKPDEWQMEDENEMPAALEADAAFRALANRVSLDALRAYLAHELADFDSDLATAEIRAEFGAAELWGRLVAAVPARSEIADSVADVVYEAVGGLRQEKAVATVGHAVSAEAQALAILAEHPDWTYQQIADRIGCHPKSLSRMPKLRAARQILKSGKNEMPRGIVDEDGQVLDANG
jgi:hypothetical protein